MRTVRDVDAWALRQWNSHWPGWLANADDETPAAWRPLHPPTESELAADPDAVAAWVRSWQVAERSTGVAVQWVERSWRAFGRQRLPERVGGSPAVLARLAKQADAWNRAVAATEMVRRAWPAVDFTAAVQAGARALSTLSTDDTVRLVRVLAWLATHPHSDMWEREVPVEGIDSKWVERHRRLLGLLMGAIDGRAAVGLRRHGVLFRIRFLDDQAATGSPADFAMDLDGLARLQIQPHRVLVCENLTCLDTLPELPRTVALHGMGFAAPLLAEIPWVRSAHVGYWGDMDSYGFAILGQVRAALSTVGSVLMDPDTLRAYERFAVTEPRPYAGEVGHLTLAERDTLAALRRADLRLEQERLPRPIVAEALRVWVGSVRLAAGNVS